MSSAGWQVVVGFMPVVFTDPVSVPGVVLLCCDTINQPFPQAGVLSFVVALNDTMAPVLVPILITCDGGCVVPVWKANESEVGVTVSAGVPAIVTVTWMVVAWPLPPRGVSVTVPLKGPAVEASWAGLPVTVILPVVGVPVNCRFPEFP